MAGKLYLCATPIGNLDDITFRVLNTLREVDLIAAEDTRVTRALLNHFGIDTPTVSNHQHNEEHRASPLIEKMLEENSSVKIYPGHSWQIEPYKEEGQDYLDLEYLKELILMTSGIIEGRVVGEKIEIPMDIMKGIDIRSAKGRCVTDYCYDAEHIIRKD